MTTVARGSAAAPDMVLFLADDLSRADCSIYGGQDARTPNLARLAATSMVFDRAYVASPSCAPSRAALLTGLMPARNGAEANHSKARADLKKLPAYLEEVGYEVVAFGKVAHYGHAKDYGFGRAEFEGFHDHRGIPAAVEFLKKRPRGNKPLCLIVGSNWPHRPWPTNAPGLDPAKLTLPPTHPNTPETRAFRARYLAAVELADADLGAVYEAARASLGPDALFLMSSDHGAQWPFGKWTCYEDGLCVPLVIAWPGAVAAGTRTDAMVSWVDLLPTLVEIAGGKAPATGAGPGGIDGRSFLPVLRGQSVTHRDRIFATHTGDKGMNVYPTRSVRAGSWKLIWNLHPEFQFTSHIDRAAEDDETAYWRSWERAAAAGDVPAATAVRRYREHPEFELYDLSADPLEQRNLAAEPSQTSRLASLRVELETWMTAQGDQRRVHQQPVLLGPGVTPAAIRAAARPHIVFVLADDMGLGDIGIYGGTVAPTLNLDRLAREGTRFTRYYSASPICSPSRCGLITGQFPARWQITSFLQTRAGNRVCEQADFLDPRAPSLPRLLKAEGYTTAHVGKWHLGGGRDVTNAPPFAAYGYDVGLGTYESPEPAAGLGLKTMPWGTNREPQQVARHERTRWMVDETLAFLKRNADGACFVNLWLDDTHTPWVPRELAQGARAPRANLRAVLQEMDRQIGRLMDAVPTNTLLIFATDNGALPTLNGERSLGLRGSKLSLYDGGIRLPLIARWPGRIPAGRVDDSTVLSAVDMLPTLAALVHARLPDEFRDGEDLSAALLGKPAMRSKPLFWEYGRNETGFKFPAAPDRSPNVAILDGSWKLLINADGTRKELYELNSDPKERTNLVARQADVARRLSAQALDWRKSLP